MLFNLDTAVKIADGSCTKEMRQTLVQQVKINLLSLSRHNHLISQHHMEILGHLLAARHWICTYQNICTIIIIILFLVYSGSHHSFLACLYCIIFLYNSYFIDLNDKTLADQCDSFENGICDDDFNSIDFRYDGGVSIHFQII